jgi:hypothetical protein
MFWTNRDKSGLTAQGAERPEMHGRMSTLSQVSRLTDDMSGKDVEGGGENREEEDHRAGHRR